MSSYHLQLWCQSCQKSIANVPLALPYGDVRRIIRAHENTRAHTDREAAALSDDPQIRLLNGTPTPVYRPEEGTPDA